MTLIIILIQSKNDIYYHIINNDDDAINNWPISNKIYRTITSTSYYGIE